MKYKNVTVNRKEKREKKMGKVQLAHAEESIELGKLN